MLTERFRATLQEYHRKKWFPEKYPDPFGEFIDYISEGMVADLVVAWKRDQKGSYLDVARYLLQLLSEIQFQEPLADYRRALSQTLHAGAHAESSFFALRNLNEEDSLLLWRDLQQWSGRWEMALRTWTSAILNFEKAHSDFYKEYGVRLRLPHLEETQLRSTRELFAWQFQNRSPAVNYREFLRYLALEKWRTVADWGDLPALAKSIQESTGSVSLELIQGENPAARFLFPVLPPERVVLEYGNSNGPADAMLFLIELGKGIYYASINPQLRVEERVCGDPSLPWFWGFLYASLLADPEGVKVFVGSKAESMVDDTRFLLECWYRHEAFLTIYRDRALNNSSHVEDLFSGLWELAYPMAPPAFLALLELSRSNESVFRWHAMMRAFQVIKYLRLKYGRSWFQDGKWIRRARDYRWEGFRITTEDIVADLQIDEPAAYPF